MLTAYREPLEPKPEPQTLRLVPYPRAILVALAAIAAILAATFAARSRRLDIDCTRPTDDAPWTCTRVERRLGITTDRASVTLPAVQRELTLAPVDEGSVALAKTPHGPIEIARFPSHQTPDANVEVVYRLSRALDEPGAQHANAVVETKPWSAVVGVVALFLATLPILGPIRASRLRIDPRGGTVRIERVARFRRKREEVPLSRVRHVSAVGWGEAGSAVVLRVDGGDDRMIVRSHLPPELLESQAAELSRALRSAREQA